jgi:predicted RNase H-like HicB family nuclease
MDAAAEYLKKPYGRLLVPEEDGTYRAEIMEFPGCIAVGDTAAEAVENLENAAIVWVEATIERGRSVPEPMEELDYSGKLVVRLPRSLHKRAAYMANREGISLNQFMVSSIAEQVGAYRWSLFNKATAVTLTITLQSGTGKSVFLPQPLSAREFSTLLTPPLELLANASS